MKFSIITISFNQGHFLERAIRSIIDQDYDDIEYILVDPGSTDDSRDIIQRYAHRVDTLLLAPDDGPTDGLNNGFAAATGDIAGYINADDALLPGAIGEVAEIFESDPSLDIVIGHGYIIDIEGRATRHFRSARFTPRRYALGAGTVMQQSTFFRLSRLHRIGGFNLANHTSWDGELLLRMALDGAKIKVFDRYWSLFTIHDDSLSGGKSNPHECLYNHQRYFEMVFGRREVATDKLARRIAWAQRWFLDPVGVLTRLSDKLLGPPHLHFPCSMDDKHEPGSHR